MSTRDPLKNVPVVKEGIEGYYRYHLALPDHHTALCGRLVMHTGIPLSAWGTKTHLNEKWCEKCKEEHERAR